MKFLDNIKLNFIPLESLIILFKILSILLIVIVSFAIMIFSSSYYDNDIENYMILIPIVFSWIWYIIASATNNRTKEEEE